MCSLLTVQTLLCNMNFKIFLTYACSALSAYAQASLQNPADTDMPPIIDGAVSANYRVVARDGNSKVWAQVTWETNLVTREVISKTNSYVELATGSAHLADKGAQATNSQHQVAFLGNINMLRAVDLTLPEGDKHLAATIIGLAYEDESTGKSVLIAELKDSFGQLLPSGNQVLYPDAFTDFEANAVKADVLYQNKISGLEQLIVIRQQLPAPSEWGLSDDSTVLQVITAFEGSPQPAVPWIGIRESVAIQRRQAGEDEANTAQRPVVDVLQVERCVQELLNRNLSGRRDSRRDRGAQPPCGSKHPRNRSAATD